MPTVLYNPDCGRAGSSFPRTPFNCTVHSVFTHALNFRLDSEYALLSLVSDKTKMHPRSALVPHNFNTVPIEIGMVGNFDGKILSFADAFAFYNISYYRNSPEDERPLGLKQIEKVARHPADPRSSWLKTIHILNEISLEMGIVPSISTLLGMEESNVDPSQSEYTRRFVAAARSIEHACTEKSIKNFNKALDSLIGLGPGLTPSGDDFICGYLAGCRTISLNDKQLEAFLDAWAISFCDKNTLDSGLLLRTNDISAAFLWEAAQGRFSQALISFANSIFGFGNMESSLKALASIGHSSGIHTAAGYLYALGRNHAPSFQLYGSKKPCGTARPIIKRG